MGDNCKKIKRNRSGRIPVRDLDAFHIIMPYLVPGRTNNEAVLTEDVDIENIQKYVDKKNAENPAYKYTWFQVITAAIAKTIYLRPKMNYFITGRKFYERTEIQTAFVVKRTFDDHSEESCAKWILDPEGASPIEQLHTFLEKFVNKVRVNKEIDHSSQTMNVFKYIPSFLLSLVFGVIKLMDRWGIYPRSFQLDDPCYSSVFITNLGSIKMDADYHHIFNWGTNSFFVVVSEKKKRLIVNEDGTTAVRDTIKIALTIDERIADGYYFAKSVKLLKQILQNPELLDKDVKEPIEIDF